MWRLGTAVWAALLVEEGHATHDDNITMDECAADCSTSTCAGSTCSIAGQSCNDPHPTLYVLQDWSCNCNAPHSGRSVGRAATCELDECAATCGTCANTTCNGGNYSQSCVDLNVAIDSTSDWACRCDYPLSGQMVGQPTDCILDECAVECATCQGTAGPRCGRASIAQTCMDPNTTVESTLDWRCHCDAPYEGSNMLFISLCTLDECNATCPTCYSESEKDCSEVHVNSTCLDPDKRAFNVGDWLCGVDECANIACPHSCTDLDLRPSSLGDARCEANECTTAGGNTVCAAGVPAQACRDPDLNATDDWVCLCDAPNTTLENTMQVGRCVPAPTPRNIDSHGVTLTFDQNDVPAVSDTAAAYISAHHHLTPPSAAIADGEHAEVQLNGQGIVDTVGIVHSIVWWFRLDTDTDVANFYIDANSSGWDGDYEYRFIVPHYSNTIRVKASTFAGIEVESPFLEQPGPFRMNPGSCGKTPGGAFKVLRDTWHQITIDFHYRQPWDGWRSWGTLKFPDESINGTKSTFFDVTFDKYPICEGVLWNHTTSAADWLHFTKFHFSPGIREMDPFCSNVSSGESCRGVEGGKVYVDSLSLCNTTSDVCGPMHKYRSFDCRTYKTLDDCEYNMRCHWRADTQRCVESTLSRFYEVREEHTVPPLVFEGATSILSSFTPLNTTGGWSSHADGVAYSTTPGVGVLQSPPITIGPGTRILVDLSDDSSAAHTPKFAATLYPMLEAKDGGFFGVGVGGAGGWTVGRGGCGGTSCRVELTVEDLAPLLHAEVTIDLIDADNASNVYFSRVQVIRSLLPYDSSTALTPPPTGWFQGIPCKGTGFESSWWEGVTCEGPRAKDIGRIEVNHAHLGGQLDELDFGMYPNLHTLNLNGNKLVGDGYKTINDSHYLPDALEELSLGDNRLTGLLPALPFSPNLKRLNFSHQDFEGPLPLRYFQPPQLPEPFQKFHEIQTVGHRVVIVDLGYEPVNPGPYDFAMLDVSGNPRVNGTIPANFSRHPTFEVLRANGCDLEGVIPNPLGPKMYDLDLGNNNLTGIAPFIEDQTDARWGFVGLANNSLVGLIPEWIKNARRWELNGNDWCCPLPHWTRYPPPYYTLDTEEPQGAAEERWAEPRYSTLEEGGLPTWPLRTSLHWLRTLPPDEFSPPTCRHPDTDPNADPAVPQNCPTVKGPCDGAITCRTLRCTASPDAPVGSDDPPQTDSTSHLRVPGYLGCACDMRRARCVYRPESNPLEQACKVTSDHGGSKTRGVCIDLEGEFHTLGQPGPAANYGPPVVP